VCQEKIPHTITPPPAAWSIDTIQDGSMLSGCLRQILTLPSECCGRNRDSSDQATLFQFSVIRFFWACVNYSLIFLFLADRSGTGVSSAAVAHMLQGLMCCAFRDALLQTLVVMHGFEFLLPFYQLEPAWPWFSSNLWHQQSIFAHRTATHFLFFGPFSVNPWDGCVKIPVDQQFLKYSFWHQQPCHVT